MTELEVYDAKRFTDMEQVADLFMEGAKATDIAKTTGLQRKYVVSLIEEWRETALADQASRDLARETLTKMVSHYDKLIKQYYELIDDLQDLNFSHNVAAQINSALKNIADLEAKRVDALQKAGILDANEMGDEVARMEEKQAIIVDILRNDLCPACKAKTASKLGLLTGRVETVRADVQ